jgi:DNA-binding IclR family transcriptional regulator
MPRLTDDEKRPLCAELEAMGLLRRDAQGRWRLTQRGNLVGAALYAFALHEEAVRRADVPLAH